ncbi:MAG: right-handed parallel beta-helix repeat-containing protein [Verrucomicrobia bacterium]|nr:right-handed parallel beta-helix repeat-containing protein [Verrucomicrobiota bacterium]
MLVLIMAIARMGVTAEFHVSPGGNDANAGTAALPFRTLERARDAVRAQFPRAGSAVIVHQGIYQRETTLELGAADSGAKNAPVVWKAAHGGTVRLVGGKSIPSSAARPVTNAALLARVIDPKARPHLLQVDLRAFGITNYGALIPRGFGRPVLPQGLEVFIDGQPTTMASWPNDKYIPLGRVIDGGSVPRYGDLSNRGGTFQGPEDRLHFWGSASNSMVTGYLGNGYAGDTIPIKSINLTNKTITLADAYMYGIANAAKWGERGSTEYYVANLLEEIDQPGESYLDRQTGVFYFYPPAGTDGPACLKASAEILVSMLEAPLVAMENTSYVTMEGMTLEVARGMGICIEGGRENLVTGCTLRNLGMVAVSFGQGVVATNRQLNHEVSLPTVSRELGNYQGQMYGNNAWDRKAGQEHGIVACDIYNIGAGGIILGGGVRKTLTPGGNYLKNCHLHHLNRIERSFRPAVSLDGVGNRVEHCLIHDVTDQVFFIHGNDHVLAYNEIYRAQLEGSEMGVVYAGRNPSEYGNIVRRNFFHHNGNPNGYTAVVHLDDFACGLRFEQNICYRNDRKIWINGGYHHSILNNIFIENCSFDSMRSASPEEDGIRVGKPPAEWAKELSSSLTQKRVFTEVNALAEPFRSRYPDLAAICTNTASSLRTDRVWGNVLVRSGVPSTNRPKENPGGDNLKDNLVTDTDVGFVDASVMDFRLRNDSLVYTQIPGFPKIPFDEIGLYQDQYRKIPIKRVTTGTRDYK